MIQFGLDSLKKIRPGILVILITIQIGYLNVWILDKR